MSTYTEILGYIRQLERRLAALERLEDIPAASGTTDHGSLTGLTDDDHAQYVLANSAGGRTAFAANWTDLTDSGATTLHKHDHGGLDGLGDDDHAQYVLASSAGGRTAFAANWTDLTDSGATTLHKHDHGGQDGLADDDHTQYLLASGARSGATAGAQLFNNAVFAAGGIIGSNSANGDLTINGTSDATKTSSYVLLQPSGGNVGIGTASPGWPLHIEKDTAGDGNVAFFANTNSTDAPRSASIVLSTYAYAHTMLRQNGGAGTQTLGGAVDTILLNTWTANDNGHLHLGTNNAIQMTVKHGGNVGIGTTDPTERLHVNGNLAINNRFYTTYYGNYVNFGYTTWYGYFGLNVYADDVGNLRRALAGYGGRGTGMMFADDVQFFHTPAGTVADAIVTPTIDMHIDHATGNVGIGTIAPDVRLHADGTIGSSGASAALMAYDRTNGGTHAFGLYTASNVGRVYSWGGGADVMTFTETARVGIGTSGPSGKLDVEQTSSTGTIPTLFLRQDDVSEQFIDFRCTGAPAAGYAIDTAAVGTYYGKIRVSTNGTFKYIALYNS